MFKGAGVPKMSFMVRAESSVFPLCLPGEGSGDEGLRS